MKVDTDNPRIVKDMVDPAIIENYRQINHLCILGGPTYCALAALHLAPSTSFTSDEILKPKEQRQTIRWLVQNQDQSGGFRGRTEKNADACYDFWCGASLDVCTFCTNFPGFIMTLSPAPRSTRPCRSARVGVVYCTVSIQIWRHFQGSGRTSRFAPFTVLNIIFSTNLPACETLFIHTCLWRLFPYIPSKQIPQHLHPGKSNL